MSDSPTVSFVPLKVGTKAGPYRIVRELGIGGMGQVFLAEDTRLDRQVALKFLSHDLAQKDDFRQRFMREAKAAAKLNHYNIVTIHDVGEALQRIYIAMEYVEGRTLRQMIDTRALSFDQSIDVFTQLCQGLKKAHSAGIIHRDLKPANIMVTAEGQVKILDFGLAKVVMSGDLTNTNAALGTVNYMSPEQAQGAEVDQRSDLFSSGILLFEMLAGVNPFVRGHMPATIHAITYEPIGDLASYTVDLPDDCQTVIDKAVGKRPEDRYQTVDEFLDDIERLNQGKKITPAVVAQPNIPRSETSSMAVLFLRNLGSQEDEYLCHGITEDLIVDISRLGPVKVLPMYKVVKYKETDLGPDEIARKLGVTMILDGSLYRSGEIIRISAQLVDISNEEILWSNRWDAGTDSLPKIKTALANGIMSALEVDSSIVRKGDIGKAATSNPEAYDLYLKGKFAFDNRKKREDVDQAQQFFNRALELEPKMIAAKVGLAEILVAESKHKAALDLLRPALEDARQRGMRADEARVSVAMGIAHNRIREYDESIERLNSAASIFAQLQDVSGEAWALSELLKPLNNTGDYDRVLGLEDHLNELAGAGAEGRWIAQGKFFLAVAVYFYRADHARATTLAEEALQLSKAHGFHYLTAQILAAVSHNYGENGKIELALAYIEEARYIAERLGDWNLLRSVGFRTSLLEMSSGAFRQFYNKADELYSLLVENHDTLGAVSHLVNRAIVCQYLGKYEEAFAHLDAAEKETKANLSGQHASAAYSNIFEIRALVNLEMGHEELALDLIQKAKNVAGEHKHGNVLASIYTSGGEIYFKLGLFQKAKEWFERGAKFALECKDLYAITICSGHLALMDYRQNPDEESIASLRRIAVTASGHIAEVPARRLLGTMLLEDAPSKSEYESGRRELMRAIGLARHMEWVPEMNRIQAVLDRNE